MSGPSDPPTLTRNHPGLVFKVVFVCVNERECAVLALLYQALQCSFSFSTDHKKSAFQHSFTLLKAPQHCKEEKYDPNTSQTICTGDGSGDDGVEGLGLNDRFS